MVVTQLARVTLFTGRVKVSYYETPFTQIAKQFEVSDNAIRKWCNRYNLPRK